MIAGTLAYMPPEQAEGRQQTRGRIFSRLGRCCTRCSRRQAFTGDTGASILAAVLREEPPPLGRDIPRDLERVVVRCLQKDPARRFQHIDDVWAALQEVKEESDSGARAAASPRPKWSAKAAGLGVAVLVSVVALMIVLNVGNWHGRVFGGAGASRIESLAVLPVKNYSGDPGARVLRGWDDRRVDRWPGADQGCQGHLAHLGHALQGHEESLPQIARELGVDGIVEASVLRSGGQVRITARLIDARQDRHLWASNYERQMTDVLALQSDVVQAIAGEIRVQITPQESGRLKAARQVDPEVYDTTLKAGAILEYAMREEQFRQAIELFQKAIDRDPTYAPAWAGLGEALWSWLASGDSNLSPQQKYATGRSRRPTGH